MCPCNLMYIGLTTRRLKVRIQEHVMDIQRVSDSNDIHLKTLARQFKGYHGCDPKVLRVKGIHMVSVGKRGGDWKNLLAQMESKWIFQLDTIHPRGFNEVISFAPFL